MARPERPVQPEAGPVGELAQELRAIRKSAGSPTYRTLAAWTHYSAATLARAASGHTLPTREVTVAYAVACGGDPEEWTRRWAQVASAMNPPDPRVAIAPAAGAALGTAQGDDAGRVGAPADGGFLPRSRRAPRVVLPAAGVIVILLLAGLAAGDQSSGIPTTALRALSTKTSTGSDDTPGSECDPNGITAPEPPSDNLRISPTPTLIRADFEGGPLRWGPFWNAPNVHEEITTEHAYHGTHAQRVQVGPGLAAIGTTHIDGLHPGSVVTLHIWYSGQGSGRICPFVQDTRLLPEWVQQEDLELATQDRPGWRAYTWTMPDLPVHGIGIQLNNTGANDFVILLDAVTW